jgi:hypothetical protein
MTEISTRKFSLTEVSIIQVGIAQIRITKIGQVQKIEGRPVIQVSRLSFFCLWYIPISKALQAKITTPNQKSVFTMPIWSEKKPMRITGKPYPK